MLRMIVQVAPPDDEAATPGQYRTFDVMNSEMEKFLSANGLKGIIGYEIRENPPIVLPVKKDEPKVDPDAEPKPTGNSLQDKLASMKWKRANDLKAGGKLPAKLKPDESIMDQLARYDAVQRTASEKESEERKKKEAAELEKSRQEFNKRLKEAQEAYDAKPIWKRLGKERPTKASLKEAEKAEKAAAS